MKKKIIIVVLTIFMIINVSSCKGETQVKKYQASFLVLFNTVTEVVAYTETKGEFSTFASLIYDSLEEYHQQYDKYNYYDGINNIKTINDNAGISPIKVDKKIIDLLLYSKEMYDLTEGKVNIALGPVLEIWHNYRTEGVNDPENAKLPAVSELEQAMKYTDIHKVIIDEVASTVFLEDEQMRLDVGAIAKGYATEQVKNIANKKGYPNFLLSVGGNVSASGSKGEKEESWNVGIKNPDQEAEEGSLFILAVNDLSLVSSGNYERYYTVNGKEYHHIINPETLMPSEYFTAVSVVCKDSGMADTLSTAIYNMPFEEGKELINSLEATEALWIFQDGKMKFSEGFEALIK